MDAVLFARLQFAVTVFFHFVFVPLTLGLTVLLAIMETLYVRSGKGIYKRMVQFWGKLFLINFVLGVVTGITLEFQFGTNWSRYSEYVGDIFGSLLAIEATLAFFLESTFVAVWAFGWKKVSPKTHLGAIWAVAIASNLSALWIILANGWMQHPVGYVIRNGRAELDSFFSVVTNPFAWSQFLHNLLASWALAGFFVLGISAWHLIKKNQIDFFKRSFRIAAPFTLLLVILLGLQGHGHGQMVAVYQPEKLAAMESHWDTTKNAPMYLLAWPHQSQNKNLFQAFPVPNMLSFLAFGDAKAEVKGLADFPKENQPPVLPTFLSFRLMAALGTILGAIAALAFLLQWRIEKHPFLLKIFIWAIPLPYVAIFAGWTVAEVGRQPWIVHGMMRTSTAVSPVPAYSVIISLIAFTSVYTLLGAIDIHLLRKHAMQGPEAIPEDAPETH